MYAHTHSNIPQSISPCGSYHAASVPNEDVHPHSRSTSTILQFILVPSVAAPHGTPRLGDLEKARLCQRQNTLVSMELQQMMKFMWTELTAIRRNIEKL